MTAIHIIAGVLLWLRGFFGNAVLWCAVAAGILFLCEVFAYRGKTKKRKTGE